MCSQTLQSDPSICEVIANWNASVQPAFSDNDGLGVWNFRYENGNPCQGKPREFEASFIGNPNTTDYNVIYAGLSLQLRDFSSEHPLSHDMAQTLIQISFSVLYCYLNDR